MLSACASQVDSGVAPGAPGFLLGLWHGFIFPISWVLSLLMPEVAIYAVPNNGGWYDFGYFLGVCVFGVGARKTHVVYRDRVVRGEEGTVSALDQEAAGPGVRARAAPRPPWPRIARRVITTGLALALGAVLLGTAARSPWVVDQILLGISGVVLVMHAIFWQSELFENHRNSWISLPRLACSPLTLYPLGALILLRFIFFPADDLSQGVGLTAGLLFLSPFILIFLIAMMFIIGSRRR